MNAFMAFLHHVAAFTLVAALAVEFVLIRDPLTPALARRLARADMVLGLSATVLAVVGLLRVFYFEKGAGYYFGNVFFLTKLTLFILAGLISIYPTVLFISWNKALRQGQAPALEVTAIRRVRLCMMLELTAILGILFCAPFMARGIG